MQHDLYKRLCAHTVFVSLAVFSSQAGGVAQASQPSVDAAWVEREVLDGTLTPTLVRVQSLTATELIARTRDGRPVRMSIESIVALVTTLPDTSVVAASTRSSRSNARLAPLATPSSRTPQTASTPRQGNDVSGRLLLTDGQVLAGGHERDLKQLNLEAPDGLVESLPWRSGSLGTLVLPLERIAVASFLSTTFDWPMGLSGDVVRMRNGDIISGFVDVRYIPGEADVTVTIESDAGNRRLALRRVESIFLGNPSQVESGAWVWLHDGSVLRIGATDTASGDGGPASGVGSDSTVGLMLNNDRAASVRTTFASGASSASSTSRSSGSSGSQRIVSMDSWEVVAFAPRRERIGALANQPWKVTTTERSRRWTMPPIVGDPIGAALGAPDIELPGPMSVTWTLPAGVTRVAGVAELPVSARAWGDCSVVMFDGAGAQVWTTRLSGDAPSAPFNIDLSGKDALTLTVRVEAGANGPIEDRVLLRRVLLLLDNKQAN